MKVFEIAKGTIGSVYFPDPSRRKRHNWEVRKDLMFEREEMIFDPVSYANRQLADKSKWCKMMAAKGFAGFKRDGWLLVVPYSEVRVY